MRTMNVRRVSLVMCAAVGFGVGGACGQVSVSTVAELVSAVAVNPQGTTINLAAGVYELPSSLKLKFGMNLIGAGIGQTVIRNGPGFQFPVSADYDGGGVCFDCSNPNAYLIDLGRDRGGNTIQGMTLTGPEVYGGIHYVACNNITITGVEFVNFRWSGIRGFVGDFITIANNRFVDAGGSTVNPDGSFGGTGGSLFISYMGRAVISNNRFERTGTRPDNVFGIKGREFRNTVISNNTVRCDFAIELPFENDYYVDILNNYLDGVLSVPRWAGGYVPPEPGAYTFKVRENYFTKSYSIEGPHNAMIVERNVFDFPVDSDYGNLFASFDPWSETPLAPGPLDFNNNIVINPGRGVFWSDVVWNNLSFTNNHVVLNERSASQYPEGLFSFRDYSPAFGGQVAVMSSNTIASNIVEIVGQPRNLIRWSSGYGSNISNNLLINVSDSGAMPNPQTGQPRGPLVPLNFNVGVNGEIPVNGQALMNQAAAGVCCRGTTCTLVLPSACVSAGGFGLGAKFNTPALACGASASTTAGCCFADMNKDQNVSVEDIFIFLRGWFGGSPLVKWNGDGATGTPGVQDLFAFLAAWFAGCA